MKKYTDAELLAMPTPLLHRVNENYRSRHTKHDAGRRAAEGSEGGLYGSLGWDNEPPAQAYHDYKSKKWTGHYQRTSKALKERGERETPYTTEGKDTFSGAMLFARKGGPIERVWNRFVWKKIKN